MPNPDFNFDKKRKGIWENEHSSKSEFSFFTFERGKISNSISKPIQDFKSLISQTFEFFEPPFIHQIFQILVFVVILVVLFLLYPTIGLASQIGNIIFCLILEAKEKMKIGGPLEKSCYSIAIGIYICFGIPFWIITFPFWLLGIISDLLGDVFWFSLAATIGLLVVKWTGILW